MKASICKPSLLAGGATLGAALLVVALLCPSQARADSPADFAAEAKLFYQAVACGGDRSAVPSAHAEVVAAHCRQQAREIALFRKRYVAKAEPFFAKERPANPPSAVVYPFGGGDLISALITYPDATEITTMSLEHAGDPRRLGALDKREMQRSLLRYRTAVRGLLRNHDNASVALRTLERGPIPGQLSFFIQALAIMGYEPVSLKFFKLQPDGAIHYYTQSEIAALSKKKATRKATKWVDTDYSIAFSNMELGFRKGDASGPVIVHRHLAANLNNDRFAKSPLRAHLVAKGKVAAMTKAASYLLWSEYFSSVRSYLLENMALMISDSTGIPPRLAAKAGFEQITFGRFAGSYLEAPLHHNKAFRQLWKSQPYRPLKFRYGYWDSARNAHLMITRPKS